MGYQQVAYEKDRDGVSIVISTLSAVINGRVVVVNVSVWPDSKLCQIYYEGWTDDKIVGRINGENQGLCVEKRGWIKSVVAVKWGDVLVRFQTSNEFGDILRKLYGSDALIDYTPSSF